ncbi:MAG: CAP domain-containing protein [Pseudomonadota bacterium]
MARRLGLIFAAALAVAGCTAPPVVDDGSGVSRNRVYRISQGDASRIQFRMLDSVNSLRQAAGLPGLELNSRLNAAAATHSRDMSRQDRPWHFGSDGSSPLDRVRRAGYSGVFHGENISETFESELQTLAAWMEVPATRAVVMSPAARDLGIAWFQESNGKIWWTMITGG